MNNKEIIEMNRETLKEVETFSKLLASKVYELKHNEIEKYLKDPNKKKLHYGLFVSACSLKTDFICLDKSSLSKKVYLDSIRDEFKQNIDEINKTIYG